MADQKKKISTRGRGRGGLPKDDSSVGMSGRRWQKLEDVPDVRPPKKEETKAEFHYTPTGFPPLPKPSTAVEEANVAEAPVLPDVCLAASNPEVETVTSIKPDHEKLNEIQDPSNALSDLNIEENTESKESSVEISNSIENVKDTASESDVPVSLLSPYAEEFVPRCVQNMDPTANDFIPINVQNNVDLLEDCQDNDALIQEALETLSFCYSKLTESPGLYDQMMEIVNSHVINYLRFPEVTDLILHEIYSYCLSDASFTYNAVKMLINFLDLEIAQHKTNFLRDKILNLARNEAIHVKEEILLTPEMDYSYVTPCILFLCDLYTRLFVGGMRLVIIGQAVVEVLSQLLVTHHVPVKERFDIVIKAIKLTGVDLDADNSSILDSFFELFDAKVEEEKPNIDLYTYETVRSLIHLRSENWMQPSTQFTNEDPDNVYTNGMQYQTSETMGVFYGPDGHVLPYEEQIFLETSSAQFYHTTTVEEQVIMVSGMNQAQGPTVWMRRCKKHSTSSFLRYP